MAGAERTWVRQAFMKRSFMRRRTTAIYDCWPDPLAGARSVSRKGLPLRTRDRLSQSLEADFDVVIHEHRRVIRETGVFINPAITDGLANTRRQQLVIHPNTRLLAGTLGLLRPPVKLIALLVDFPETINTAHFIKQAIKPCTLMGQETGEIRLVIERAGIRYVVGGLQVRAENKLATLTQGFLHVQAKRFHKLVFVIEHGQVIFTKQLVFPAKGTRS